MDPISLDPTAFLVELLIGDMFDITPDEFLTANPEARDLVDLAVELGSEPGPRLGWGSPEFEEVMDELDRRYRPRRHRRRRYHSR